MLKYNVMFRCFFVFFMALVLNSCNSNKPVLSTNTNVFKLSDGEIAESYLKHIDQSVLKKNLYTIASDSMQGRATGTLGQQKVATFLKNSYKKMEVSSPSNLDYYQNIPKSFFNGRSAKDAPNVLAYIKGKELPDQLVIISAHYDHLGLNNEGQVHNGADDNGSGTAAILQIAKAFKAAVDDGFRPKRSILFLHFVGEEIGLYGSKYYVENPVFPLFKTVVDLNIDMIGRVDEAHTNKPDYMYVIGSDKLSNELHQINEAVNLKYHKMDFDYKFNAKNDPNRFYYRSDHYNFAKNNIPVIFYFNGTHSDYHQISDTPDKIDYSLLKKRVEHIFLTAWELANRQNRIILD